MTKEIRGPCDPPIQLFLPEGYDGDDPYMAGKPFSWAQGGWETDRIRRNLSIVFQQGLPVRLPWFVLEPFLSTALKGQGSTPETREEWGSARYSEGNREAWKAGNIQHG